MTTTSDVVLAKRNQGGYSPAMSKNVLVRNVPDSVHAALVRRAEAEGKSLQEYVLAVLRDVAGTPTMSEVMNEVRAILARNPGPRMTREEMVAVIRERRDR
jgi:plasmid stability protein